MKKSTLNARDMAYISLCAGLLSLSAWISIPAADIYFTMQTFALFFLLDLLGGKRTFLALAVYLGLGAAGLPVFAGFQSGLGTLLGVTGGYIWGFLLTALLWWLISPEGKLRIPTALLGLLLCYGCGTAWYFFAYTQRSLSGLLAVAGKCVVPYLIPDTIKLILSLRLARRLKPLVKL